MEQAPVTTVADSGGMRVEHLDRKSVRRSLSRELAPIVKVAEETARELQEIGRRTRRR